MREHIIRFLLETEQSYISSLQTLSKDYQDILYQIDCQSLQEVLLLVPNLASLHQDFVVSLSERIREWCEDQCIGDLLVQTVSHFNNVSLAIKTAILIVFASKLQQIIHPLHTPLLPSKNCSRKCQTNQAFTFKSTRGSIEGNQREIDP
jgi:hypothetical protein